MKIREKKGWLLLLGGLFGLMQPLSSLLAAESYDVSYFWTTALEKASAYAHEAKRVLGPDAAEQIKIVYDGEGLYGVIYNRDGSYQTTLRLAQRHAQLLYQTGVTTQRGREAACPVPDREYRPIPSVSDNQSERRRQDASMDSNLEARIEQYIKGIRRRGLLSQTDQTSFVVYDISRQKKLVSINEDRPMMAASLIKNFVMLAYFHEVAHRRIQHTKQNRLHLCHMIQKSSNSSTNHLIRLLGGPSRVNRILHANYPYFEQTHIVEYIPKGGRTYRNRTSAHDLNRFYNQVWLGNLPYSDKMKYYLGLPNGDRIHKGTCIPANVRVYDKTGTVYGLVGDSGILVIKDAKGKENPYIFTGLIEDRTKTDVRNRSQPFASWVGYRGNLLRRISEVSYKYIYEKD